MLEHYLHALPKMCPGSYRSEISWGWREAGYKEVRGELFVRSLGVMEHISDAYLKRLDFVKKYSTHLPKAFSKNHLEKTEVRAADIYYDAVC